MGLKGKSLIYGLGHLWTGSPTRSDAVHSHRSKFTSDPELDLECSYVPSARLSRSVVGQVWGKISGIQDEQSVQDEKGLPCPKSPDQI